MESPWFWAYARMLPRLDAEETLDAVTRLMAAVPGGMEKAARAGYIRDLEDAASGGRKRKRAQKVTLGALARMGVRMVAPEDTTKAGEGVGD